jgi:hypothetical protein
MGKQCGMNGENRNAFTVLIGKPGGKRPLTGPRCRWNDKIKMEPKRREWDSVD